MSQPDPDPRNNCPKCNWSRVGVGLDTFPALVRCRNPNCWESGLSPPPVVRPRWAR